MKGKSLVMIGMVLVGVWGVLGVEIPRGYNLLNDSNNFGTFEGIR